MSLFSLFLFLYSSLSLSISPLNSSIGSLLLSFRDSSSSSSSSLAAAGGGGGGGVDGVANDPAVKSAVVDQTKQWSELMARHRREELEMMKTQLNVQLDVLKKLMDTTQAQQMRELEVIFEK